jgi:hypothetical protein
MHLKKPSFRQTDSSSSWTHKSDSLPNFGVNKALGVVQSHYEVNFEAVAEGYIVPEGVEDEAGMEHMDALAADAAGALPEAFEEFLFPDAADADADAPQA